MKKRESFRLIYDSNCKELKTIDKLSIRREEEDTRTIHNSMKDR